MVHLAFHLLVKAAIYPIFYWIGFAVTKGLSMGNAIIIPYSELGAEEGAAWWEFRIRRWGYKEWRPESMIVFGGLFVLFLVVACSVWCYLF